MTKEFKEVFVKKGQGGWGKGLSIKPTETKNKVISVTGGGIHPVAQKIADLTGAVAIDGFRSSVPDDEVAVAVIDCGGTARVGVYPMKNILTVDVLQAGPSGPLAEYINEDNFVSGVKPTDVELVEGSSADANLIDKAPVVEEQVTVEETTRSEEVRTDTQPQKKEGFIIRFSRGIGRGMSILYQAGRDSVDTAIKTVIPFMAFISLLIGIINFTGIGELIANLLQPLSTSIVGFVVMAFIASLPFLSPILGPGAVIAQVVGVLIGSQIAMGTIPVTYALPALFAINAQAGMDFIPVGLSLGEAESSTVEVGVPAILYSRVITGALSVVIGWVFSFGMY